MSFLLFESSTLAVVRLQYYYKNMTLYVRLLSWKFQGKGTIKGTLNTLTKYATFYFEV